MDVDHELDWAALGSYLGDAIRGACANESMTVRQFRNGSANLTYLLQFGTERYVLRRPPHGPLPPGAHDMTREFRVLSRLADHYPRAPRALLLCEDHGVIGAPFVLMEFREGVVVLDHVPAGMADQPEAGRAIGFAVMEALADLHAIDIHASGLTEIGAASGFLDRQLQGWTTRLGRIDNAPPIAHDLRRQLVAHVPTSSRETIVHNDFKLDNCLFDAADPSLVTGVLDWDMATVGDPLVDVGTLLNYWPSPGDDSRRRPPLRVGMEKMGLPSRAELRSCYQERTGVGLGQMPWYEAFAAWRTGIICLQLHARSTSGNEADRRLAVYGTQAGTEFIKALATLG